MTRYVIGPDVAIRLAHDEARIHGGHRLLAPTLLRSQMLSLLYQAVRRGEMTRTDAERQLNYVRGLRIRLLGDRVLQNVAWKAAGLLGWPDTFDAEYVALTQLHADALITLDRHLADAVKDLVTVAPLEALYQPKQTLRTAACPGVVSRYIVLLAAWQVQQDAEDHVATGPGLRIADADRDAVAAHLREHYAQGRLTLEEFHHRLDAVFEAATQSQLAALTRDLPRAVSPARASVAATGNGQQRAGRDHRPGSRAQPGLISVILAALAAWLLVSDLQVFPWPGRLALFLVIFAAIRWLMRFLWNLGRGGGSVGGGR